MRSGRITIADLVRLCQEAQNAVNRQAEAIEGKKTVHPGPISATIQHECTLELIGLKRGSTVLQFGFAKAQSFLPFKDDSLKAFGAEVVAELSLTIKSLGIADNKRDIAPGVLQSLYTMGGLVESERISEIDWIAPGVKGRRSESATINAKARERAAKRLSAPRNAILSVNGILDMADFKPKEMKCRIDPAIGSSIMCSFDQNLEQRVYDFMRKPVRATGEAKLQPYTDRIEMLQIKEIFLLSSLALGEGNFFADKGLSILAGEQGVKPLQSISVFSGGIAEDEDIDAFLHEIYRARVKG